MVVACNSLTYANNASHNRAQTQRWNEQAARYFHAKREYRQNQINNEC